MKTARTPVLDIAYAESGPADGRPVVLMHGFPDDVHAYDGVAPPLAASGVSRHRRVLARLRTDPVLQPSDAAFGSASRTRSRSPRPDQRARPQEPIVAGYDWGGRAACVVAALWSERVGGLVSITGYKIQNIANSGCPQAPAAEYRYWYQWYFHTDRGRAGLAANRGPLCRLLWELWSPNYSFSDADYAVTAASFDNPDSVDVVIQSYRHRYGNAPGDPAYDASEAKLAAHPPISVPTIVLHGEADRVGPAAGSESHARHFTNSYERRVIPVAGHFLPREAPEAVVAAIQRLGGS